MSNKKISIREWQNNFCMGVYSNDSVETQIDAGWYDWFCEDEELISRLNALAEIILDITNPNILDNYYVWFKNNCPLVGDLYDDVRFEPLSGERDGKYFLVTKDSPHDNKRYAIYTERFSFTDPEYECESKDEVVSYINKLGETLFLETATPNLDVNAGEGLDDSGEDAENKGADNDAPTRLYIAYGSNLNLRQMKRRCPTAKPVGDGIIGDHTMVFRGYGKGVATVEKKEGSEVPALVWEVTKEDEKALDIYEGYPKLYHKEVWKLKHEDEEKEAFIYIMNEGLPEAKPSKLYYEVIKEGYRTAGFDTNKLDDFVKSTDAVDLELLLHEIVSLRDSGKTNMFDVKRVVEIAKREGYNELLSFLKENRDGYLNFILSGNKKYLGLPDDGFIAAKKEDDEGGEDDV